MAAPTSYAKQLFKLANGGPSIHGIIEMHALRGLSVLVTAALALTGSSASAQALGANPAGTGAIAGAVQWLQGTLLGTVATVVAVIAVAVFGLIMLSGRINCRYGVTVILGRFMLFGAASIVSGIQSATTRGGGGYERH